MTIQRTMLLLAAFVIAAHTSFASGAPVDRREVKFLVEALHSASRLPAAAVQALNARVVAEYSLMNAYTVPAHAADNFVASFERAGFAVHRLDEEIIAPRRRIASLHEAPPKAPYAEGLFLVQYVAPAMPAWQADLRSSGLTVIDSLPERAVVVAGSAAAVNELSRRPWVQYAGPYLSEYKYAPFGPGETGQFTVIVADTEGSSTTIAWIKEQVGDFEEISRHANLLLARVSADLALALRFLEEPFVLGVETYVPPSPSDERQALSLTGASAPTAGASYLSWLSGKGITPNALTASGIVIDIADTGIDSGCNGGAGHLDLAGRRVYNKAMSPLGASSGDAMGHGTLVGSIAAGNPVSGQTSAGIANMGYGHKDYEGPGLSFYYGLGVAPGVRLGQTKMMNQNYNLGYAGTVAQWTTNAVTSKCNTPTDQCGAYELCPAIVQNHSHNEYSDDFNLAGTYTVNAREFDISVRNADRATGKALAITVSAGNYKQREEASTRVLAPATAKNVIAVGATESRRAALSDCTTDPRVENPSKRHVAMGYNVLAYASRRGTADSRLKPDLVAPATLAFGAKTSTIYSSDPPFCGGYGDSSLSGYPQYTGSSGTSFAAPVAAGAIALLRYYYGTYYQLVPSPAMYKAMLVGGARSIKGSLDRQNDLTVTAWPNEQQGFGVITLEEIFNTSVAKSWHDQGTVFLQTSQPYERTVVVNDISKPMRIVLAWTDAPASAGAAVTLVNNLNLRTVGPDHYFYQGNTTDSNGYSRLLAFAPPAADSRNNVEVINITSTRWNNSQNRTFTIRVTPTTLNGQGVPGASGGANNQDFALFVVNGTLQ